MEDNVLKKMKAMLDKAHAALKDTRQIAAQARTRRSEPTDTTNDAETRPDTGTTSPQTAASHRNE